jgi:hypothetical protein
MFCDIEDQLDNPVVRAIMAAGTFDPDFNQTSLVNQRFHRLPPTDCCLPVYLHEKLKWEVGRQYGTFHFV